MKRDITEDLIQWKNNPNRKPLLIKGARQVGKTWIMKDFGKRNFKQVLYVNFEQQKSLRELFNQDFDVSRILTVLKVQFSIDELNPGDTLIIFDEIQDAPGGITALKYFREEASEYYLMAAGSLLGVELSTSSFPVGQVEFLDLYPLTFYEFLKAMGENNLIDILKQHKWEIVKTFKDRLTNLLKQYYLVGGMPEAVKYFTQNKDFTGVRKIQTDILNAYDQDFAKHAPPEIIPRLKLLWQSLPSQLSRENKKFIYGLVKTGARAREYEKALSWLEDYGLINRVYRITKPGLPLKAYQDFNAFKIFALDVGLLSALSDLDEKIVIEKNRLFTEYKGALTEQYVMQQLVSYLKKKPFYWSAQSVAEVDFVIAANQQFYPIEVKAEENLRAKSLQSFRDKYNPGVSFRTSLADYRNDGWLINIPLYAVSELLSVLTVNAD